MLTAVCTACYQFAVDGKLAVELEQNLYDDTETSFIYSRDERCFHSFPIILPAGNKEKIMQYMQSIQKKIKDIPNKGLGFGIIKQNMYRNPNMVQLGFSYHTINLDKKGFLPLKSLRLPNDNIFIDKDFPLNVEIVSIDNQLDLYVGYNKSIYQSEEIKEFVHRVEENIDYLIVHEKKMDTGHPILQPVLSLKNIDGMNKQFNFGK